MAFSETSSLPTQGAFSKGSSIERKKRLRDAGTTPVARMPPQTPLKSPAFRSAHLSASSSSSSASASALAAAGQRGFTPLMNASPFHSTANAGYASAGARSASSSSVPRAATWSASSSSSSSSSFSSSYYASAAGGAEADPGADRLDNVPRRQGRLAAALTLPDASASVGMGAGMSAGAGAGAGTIGVTQHAGGGADGADDFFARNFDIDGVIGAGSFSVVYKARAHADGRYYAVKRARRFYGGAHDRRRAHAEIAHFQRVLQVCAGSPDEMSPWRQPPFANQRHNYTNHTNNFDHSFSHQKHKHSSV